MKTIKLKSDIKMKKIIAILMLAVMLIGVVQPLSAKDNKEIKTSEITSVVSSYKGKDGFTVFSIGKFGMSMVTKLAKIADDPEAVKIMKGLDKMVIVEYHDAERAVKEEFTAKISKALKGAETIMSVKDGGQSMNMYGAISDKGDTIDDLIIVVPEESTLICFFGKISAEVMGF